MFKKASAKAAPADTATPTVLGLPLFFKSPAALDSDRHAQAGLKKTPDLSFARDCNSVPLNTIEFLEAARSYPIVFTNEELPLPVAIFGWEKANPFITTENGWKKDHYIPAYVRQYPFILYQAPNSDKLYLCVDEAAPSYVADAATQGEDALPFYTDGNPSLTTQKALEFANAFYQHIAITRHFCDDLKKHNLLSPYTSTMRLDGNEKHLGGFLMINETVFNALSNEVFLEFRTKGWLPFIYLCLTSSANWKHLMTADKA